MAETKSETYYLSLYDELNKINKAYIKNHNIVEIASLETLEEWHNKNSELNEERCRREKEGDREGYNQIYGGFNISIIFSIFRRINKEGLKKFKETLLSLNFEALKKLEKKLISNAMRNDKKWKALQIALIISEPDKRKDPLLKLIRNHLWNEGLIIDGKMYNYMLVDGIIDYEGRYKLLQNTDLWRQAKRIRYILNIVEEKNQPKWEETSFHHKNPYPWEHLCTQGFIWEKKNHGRGGNIK